MSKRDIKGFLCSRANVCISRVKKSYFRWSNEENSVCEEISGLGGMELAMETWADWVASHVDPLKKKVFFVTMSPTHLW